jgi:hypothetical protein
MKNFFLKKWYLNIIVFLLFWVFFLVYSWSNHDNFITCSTNIKKQAVCKSHLEKVIFDKIIVKNDKEKIDTNIKLQNGSSTYNFFDKYGKFLWFAVWFIDMIIIFLLYGFKFMLWLWKYKWFNIVALILWYFLVFLLWLNFLYWEPRFTEIWVASVHFLGHPLLVISFYFLLILIISWMISLFIKDKKDEKSN